MQLSRREFIVASGVSGAVAASSKAFSLPQKVIYAGSEGTQPVPLEHTAVTLCRECPGGCGLKIRLINDNVVGITGNPDHPINRGGVCAMAPASVQTLYNPDRLSSPMQLTGKKGEGTYTPINWSDAIQILNNKLRGARQAPGPHSVAVMIDSDRGLSRLLWSRFLQAYGSNNLLDLSCPEGLGAYPAILAMQGLNRAIGYDLSQSQYVLSFGSQWLDAHWSPAQASDSFASLRSEDEALRPKFVHIEPRLSITGAKADEWIPIIPGTEGALALGIAHVLLREGLYDRKYVEYLTYGFDDPADDTGIERMGYRRLVLRDYSPAKVSRITGVDESTIFRLAREFSSHKPAVAMGYDGSGVSRHRCYDRMAIHSLNALVGSIDVPGGVTHFQDTNILNLPVPQPDMFAEQGLARPALDYTDLSESSLDGIPASDLADRILNDQPYPIEILILSDANPVFKNIDPVKMKQALDKIPFVVSLSPWLDDSARWADLIIPDTHYLSSWDVNSSHTLTGQPVVTIGRPCVPAPPESRSTADLIIELGQTVCGSTRQALPFNNSEDAVRAVCDALAASGRGGPFGPEDDVGWTRLLERSGWQRPAAANADEFYRKVLETGGWLDPIYYHQEWDRVFRSPPRRFAFHSVKISEVIKPRTLKEDIQCLPHYEPIPQITPGDTFPLRLYVYQLSILSGIKNPNVPWLMDAAGSIMRQTWRTWLEVNPETAHEYHITDGTKILVTSPRGKLETYAKIFAGIMPGVVAMPWGLGHEGGGRWCDGIGQHPSRVLEARSDPLTSEVWWNSTRVSIHLL